MEELGALLGINVKQQIMCALKSKYTSWKIGFVVNENYILQK